MPSTTSLTARSISSFPSSGSRWARRTAQAALIRPRSVRRWRGVRPWTRPLEPRRLWPPAQLPVGSQTSGPATGPSMCSTWRRFVSATRSALSTGADLAAIRERRPLVHQITNYVVMNETANATLALGALPVMAHAREEVEEMAAAAAALVLNIGTLSPAWVDAMLAAGRSANAAEVPVVLDPVGAGATSYRTETARRILDKVDVAVVRGNAAEIATLAGREAEIRGVESLGASDSAAELGSGAARSLGVVAAITGEVDQVSDGEQTVAIANGHPLLASITGSGCMSTAITGCFLAARSDAPLAAPAEALVAFGVAGEEAAREAKGPGSFHAALYDALAGLDRATLDERARVS